jgi:hypothetical protein
MTLQEIKDAVEKAISEAELTASLEANSHHWSGWDKQQGRIEAFLEVTRMLEGFEENDTWSD